MALGFSSSAEVYVYVTCLLLGMSILLPLNTRYSAPMFMINYYKYVTGNENAKPNSKLFWDNILTFYTVISLVGQSLVGPTSLCPAVRRLSVSLRFTLSIAFMMIEVFVVVMLPVIKVSQTTAIVFFVIVTVVGGMGKGYLQTTSYTLAAAMPAKFTSSIMFGISICGVLTSTVQCIIKASMEDTYESHLTQSYIYFSLALLILAVALVMALSLRYNSYAQEMVAEYRVLKQKQEGQKVEPQPVADVPKEVKEPTWGEDDPQNKEENKGEGEVGMTTTEQLAATPIMPVARTIRMMLLSCFLGFFVTIFIFPNLIIPIDRTHKWFATMAALIFNIGNSMGSFSTSFETFRYPRRVVLYGSIVRFLLIILFLLSIYKHIPGHTVPYIFSFILGVTHQVAVLSVVYGPITPGLNDDQKLMAGQLMGIALLAGATAASVFAMIVVIFLPQD
ncbi:unnamed protein product [Trypanosoma congolense IL3000]|uniref:WGS project CAEQ00000000 data, annotated contig 1949 n=1 Tax=Trypanosoma congolense (strain IL3000) TaxID=1068625 RepID=F9WA96_TRYCI|nr:unnamed protein product [Trypanosoma congolense IL3000]